MLGVKFERDRICEKCSRRNRRSASRANVSPVPARPELLQAFSRIESPFLRGAIIKTAREAATIIAPIEPPKSTA
jgi:hypothetical protein